MKKIIVISDTHLRGGGTRLPSRFTEELAQGADLILHAGDIVSMDVLDDLACYAEVLAVRGNMDAAIDVATLPMKRTITVEKTRIGIMHGWGSPDGLAERVGGEFPDKVRCVVFGHSHEAENKRIGDRLYFNPGSLTSRRFLSGLSFGVLYVDGSAVTGEIIQV